MKHLFLLAMLLLSPALALAQTSEFTPPPMVPSQPPPVPPADVPPAQVQPGTPPPPAATPPSYVPSQPNTGYPYSPYGQPKLTEKPSPEVGLMVSESLFGMLTSAGVTILPYFLLFGTGQLLGDSTVSSVIFVLIFSAVPLAVSQTQVSLANGSRFYASETWPAALSGLAGEAAVLGLFYLTGWLPTPQVSGGATRTGGSVVLLLVGSIAVVPLLQMVVINLTKSPKFRMAALDVNPNAKPGEGVTLSFPMPTPMIGQTREGLALGVNLPLLNMRF